MLHYTVLYYTTLYCTILYYTILYYTILHCIILYYTIRLLYYTIAILYYTILLLYYTILYYTILYYTILYYTIPSVRAPSASALRTRGRSCTASFSQASMAYRSLRSEKCSARGVRKVTTGITGLWQPSVYSDVILEKWTQTLGGSSFQRAF